MGWHTSITGFFTCSKQLDVSLFDMFIYYDNLKIELKIIDSELDSEQKDVDKIFKYRIYLNVSKDSAFSHLHSFLREVVKVVTLTNGYFWFYTGANCVEYALCSRILSEVSTKMYDLSSKEDGDIYSGRDQSELRHEKGYDVLIDK